MSLVIATEPTSLVAVEDQCSRIEMWAESCDSIPELRDAGNKLAAISEYLNLTSTEGRARVAAAQRRLEVRIGVLLGPAQRGGDRRSDQVDRDQSDRNHGIDGATASRFRAMAKEPDTVEDVIAASTDDDPASRRKVNAAVEAARARRIFEALKANPSGTNGAIGKEAKATPAQVEAMRQQMKENPDVGVIEDLKAAGKKHKRDQSRKAIEERVAKAKEMAAQGYTGRQIAEALGFTHGSGNNTFSDFKKRHGIDVPADKHIGPTRHIDVNRVIGETVTTVEGCAMAVDLVDPSDADPDQVEGWVTSLTDSLRTLNRLNKQLKEMTQ